MRRLGLLARWTTLVFGTLAIVSVAGAPKATAVDLFGICAGRTDAAACGASGQDNISGNDGILIRVSGIISVIAGIAAVIAIMISGFMFITAAGDSSKVSSARSTLTYAIVGLFVIALTRTIIVFVVSKI